ncbi:MAG: hypothetical protein V3U51_04275 [Thermoplasmata archaeon]
MNVNEGSGKKISNLVVSQVLAVVMALVFYLGATQVEGSEGVDSIGGTIYTLVLSLIIFLTLVPRIAARFPRKGSTTGSH